MAELKETRHPLSVEHLEPRKILRLMVIFPVLGGTAISGFGVHRLLTGYYGLAAFDFIVGVAFYALGFYTWRTGRETAARYISAVISAIGPLVFLDMFDRAGIYWVYSSTIVIFYLVPPLWAIFLNAVMLLGVAVVYRHADYSQVQLYSFLVTIGLINIFSLLFALDEARRKSQLRELSVKDELTGIGNRRAFVERIGEVISIHRRYGLDASLVCLDIDRFKEVNDTLGHASGDAAIRSLAEHITGSIRESDHVYRIGGDEFVIIAEGADREAALELTEKVRRGVEECDLIPEMKITISLGVAVLEDDDTADSWMAHADAALYEAKDAGRNTIRMHPAVA